MSVFRKLATNPNLTGNYVKVYLYLQSMAEEQNISTLKVDIPEIADEINISERSVYRAIDALEDEGFISTNGKSVISLRPAEFKVNEKIKVETEEKEESLETLVTTITEKVTESVFKKITEEFGLKKKKATKKIKKQEADDRIPYAQIINHLNQKTNSRFSPNGYDNKKNISARWNEGYKLEDFIKVIDYYVEGWKGTELEQYLTPKTLFNTKFDKRLNNANKGYPIVFSNNDNENNIYEKGYGFGEIQQVPTYPQQQPTTRKSPEEETEIEKVARYMNASVAAAEMVVAHPLVEYALNLYNCPLVDLFNGSIDIKFDDFPKDLLDDYIKVLNKAHEMDEKNKKI